MARIANGVRVRPLGCIDNFPITIGGFAIPISVSVLEADNYNVLIGNNWLHRASAVLDWRNLELTVRWKGREKTLKTFYGERLPYQIEGNRQSVKETDQEEEDLEEDNEAWPFGSYQEEELEEEETLMLTEETFYDQRQDKKGYIDLGERHFGRVYHKTFQAIAGTWCKYCSERAFDHHQHYLQKYGGTNLGEAYQPPPKDQEVSTTSSSSKVDHWGDLLAEEVDT